MRLCEKHMLLQLKNITKGYGEINTHSFRPVLKGLDLEILKGEKIAIIGPSGSGKTTLLNMIGALDLPDTGEVIFSQQNITGFSKKEMIQTSLFRITALLYVGH